MRFYPSCRHKRFEAVCAKRRRARWCSMLRRLAAAEVVIARRIVRLAIKRIDPDARPEMRHVERVLSCVAEGAGSVTLPAGIDARVEFGMLAFKAPVAREGLVADWVTVPGRLPLGGGRMLVAEPMAVEPGCDIVRRARELAAAGEVAALVDAAALGFADSDSERILAGSRGEIPAEARLARLWVDGPAPGDVMCPLGMSGRSKKVSDLLGRGSHSRFRARRRAHGEDGAGGCRGVGRRSSRGRAF